MKKSDVTDSVTFLPTMQGCLKLVSSVQWAVCAQLCSVSGDTVRALVSFSHTVMNDDAHIEQV